MKVETFQRELMRLQRKFTHGDFTLNTRANLRKVIKDNAVPNEYGVYIISKNKKPDDVVLYIGKAGTMLSDGIFKEQGLAKRLQAKQGGMRRAEFFKVMMKELKINELHFKWFATFEENGKNKILPAKAEADLLQVYFDENGRLPAWNSAF